MPITIVENSELEWQCSLNGAFIVMLRLDEEDLTVKFYDPNGQEFPDTGFSFRDERDEGKTYLITHGYVPKQYIRNGLGTAAVTMFKNQFKCLIYARSNDGIDRDDGSRLTEDAPTFVAALIRMGIIEDRDNDQENYEEYND